MPWYTRNLKSVIGLSLFLMIAAGSLAGCSLESESTRPSFEYDASTQYGMNNENSNSGSLLLEADSLSQRSVIRAGDRIQITVWGYPKFNTTTTVDQYGTITVPLVGEVIVAGLTVHELSGELKQRLSEYVKGNVRITISHVGISEQVSVMGAVTRQGNYSVLTERSLVSLLSQAGGTTTDADLNAIKIYRQGSRSNVTKVDLADYLRSGNIQYVPRVHPGDIVFVPERPNFIRAFSRYANEVVFLFGFFALLR